MPCMGDDPNDCEPCKNCGCWSMWHYGVGVDRQTKTWVIKPSPDFPHCQHVKGRKKETRLTPEGGLIITFVESSGTPCDCPGFDPTEPPFVYP